MYSHIVGRMNYFGIAFSGEQAMAAAFKPLAAAFVSDEV